MRLLGELRFVNQGWGLVLFTIAFSCIETYLYLVDIFSRPTYEAAYLQLVVYDPRLML